MLILPSRLSRKPPCGVRPDPTHSIMKDLVAWWPFNETGGNVVHDVGRFSAHGTLQANMPPASAWVAGGRHGGLALDFDGSNDYVVCDNEAAFDFDDLDKFSISLWLRADPSDTSIQLPLWKGLDSAPYTGYGIATNINHNFSGSAGAMTLYLFNAAGSNDLRVSYASNLNDSAWHHYVWTYDGTRLATGCAGYEDSISMSLSGAGVFSATLLNNSGMAFGARGDGSPNNAELYNGLIDNIMVWARVLRPSEVQELYLRPWAAFRHRAAAFDTVVAAATTGNVTRMMLGMGM